MALVIFEAANIGVAIAPGEFPLAVSDAVDKVTLVLLAVFGGRHACAVEEVVPEVAFVCEFRAFIDALSVPLSILEAASEGLSPSQSRV